MNHVPVLLLVSILAGPVFAGPFPRAGGETPEPTDRTGPQIMFPLLDLPYNTGEGGRAPSMQQSLAITSSFYEATHLTLERAFGERKKSGRIAIALFDLFSTAGLALPFGDVWLHEEFHRAVLGNRGIDSFNDVYELRPFAAAIAVSHVRDEDLIRLKRDHPAEQVRLNSAGAEGEAALVQRLEKQHFFGGSRAWHAPLYLLVKIGSYGYIASGVDDQINAATDEMNAEDGADVGKRDFTGHDFVAWMYDLSRPDEPYAARGIHPSGVGIDRYRRPSDLTPAERSFLKRQGTLALINFLDPNLAGFDEFRTTISGKSVSWNLTASHLLTSFGYTIDANLFLRTPAWKLFVVLHGYKNKEHTFPGVEVELVDHPVELSGRNVLVSPRLGLWLQPEDQRFRSKGGTAGGLASLRMAMPLRHRYGAFIEIEGKTEGWVSGNVSLDPDVSIRFGLLRWIG